MCYINSLKKYAINYLSKYDSSKKNLERILNNKIKKLKQIKINEKNDLNQEVSNIIKELEEKKIIDDESFAHRKLSFLINQGNSENFIKYNLLKKGIDKNLIYKILKNFEHNHPDWKLESAKKFVIKKKLGKNNDKTKDLSKMARSGFEYHIAIKALEYE